MPEPKRPLLDTTNSDNHLGPVAMAFILSLVAAVVGTGAILLLR
jgi:hypothetical protein